MSRRRLAEMVLSVLPVEPVAFWYRNKFGVYDAPLRAQRNIGRALGFEVEPGEFESQRQFTDFMLAGTRGQL